MSHHPQPPFAPYPTNTTLPPRRQPGRSLFGWIFFIALAVMLFMLLSQHRTRADLALIPLSEFTERLETGQVAAVTVESSELQGEFFDAPSANTVPKGADSATARNARRFRVALPNNLGENWAFNQWLLDHRHDATITARNDANNYVLNILLPLIPWLLIFGFIWFFVFRQLRKANRQQCLIAPTGPGRWVPDPPPPPPGPTSNTL